MSRQQILGLECRLYFGPFNDVRVANPVLEHIACVEDAQMSLTFDTVQATCRGASGFKQNSVTLGDLQITGTIIKTPSDAAFKAIELAARNRTPIDIVALDGDRTAPAADDVSGYRADMLFSQFQEAQPIADVVKISFTLVVARTGNAPVVVTAPF